MEEEEEVRKGVLNGTIPCSVVDSGALSSCGETGGPHEGANLVSNKIFNMPMGNQAPASYINKHHHEVREPAKTVDMVPALAHNSLSSISKFVDANYFASFDEEQVNTYCANNATVTVSRGAILRGWRDKKTSHCGEYHL